MLKPDPLLWSAIAHRRTIRLAYQGKERVVHDHGILNGSVHLLGYQIGRLSSRSSLSNWILTKGNEWRMSSRYKRYLLSDEHRLGKHVRGIFSSSASKLRVKFRGAARSPELQTRFLAEMVLNLFTASQRGWPGAYRVRDIIRIIDARDRLSEGHLSFVILGTPFSSLPMRYPRNWGILLM